MKTFSKFYTRSYSSVTCRYQVNRSLPEMLLHICLTKATVLYFAGETVTVKVEVLEVRE